MDIYNIQQSVKKTLKKYIVIVVRFSCWFVICISMICFFALSGYLIYDFLTMSVVDKVLISLFGLIALAIALFVYWIVINLMKN